MSAFGCADERSLWVRVLRDLTSACDSIRAMTEWAALLHGYGTAEDIPALLVAAEDSGLESGSLGTRCGVGCITKARCIPRAMPPSLF